MNEDNFENVKEIEMELLEKYVMMYIFSEFDFRTLTLNDNIARASSPFFFDELAVGVTVKERDDGERDYLYNIFFNDDKIDIKSVGDTVDVLPDAVIHELLESVKNIRINALKSVTANVSL